MESPIRGVSGLPLGVIFQNYFELGRIQLLGNNFDICGFHN